MTGVKKVTIPCDIEYAGTEVFVNCGATEIHFIAGKTGVMTDLVTSGDKNRFPLAVAYRSSNSVTKITFDEGITHIGDYYFYASATGMYSNLSEVVFPSTLKSIGTYAFGYVSGKFTCEFPTGLESIGDFAFSNSGINGGNLGGVLKEIGSGAFSGCKDLTGKIKVTDPGVTVKAYAFQNCTGITEIEIVPSDTVLEKQAFYGMTGVKKVTIPCDIEYEGTEVFVNCGATEIHFTFGKTGVMTDLITSNNKNYFSSAVSYGSNKSVTKITFDEGITHIGDYYFYVTNTGMYPNLSEVVFPSTLKSIGNYSFGYCSSLKGILIPGATESIGNYAFQGIYSDASIYGYKDSFAETYAKDNSIKFIPLYYPEITWEPQSEYFEYGKEYQLSANVCTGINTYTDQVGWSLTGNTSDDTSIDDSGLLKVADEEYADELSLIVKLDDREMTVNVAVSQEEYTVTITGDITETYTVRRGQKFDRPKDLEEEGAVYDYYLVTEDGNKKITKDDWPITIIDNTEILAEKVEHEHAYTSEVIAEATCEQSGIMRYTCECGDTYDEAIPAKGHDWGEWTTIKEPTEDEEGIQTRTCKNDPTHVEERKISVIGHTHEMTKTERVEPTCTEEGNIEYWTCSKCYKIFSDVDGQNEISEQDTIIAAAGHSEEILPYKEPTCTEPGLTEGKKCSVCGETLVSQAEIPALGHDYTETVVDPTCTQEGYVLHTCSRCGDTYTDGIMAPVGHSFGEWIVDKNSSCTEDGSKHRECSVCGFVETENVDKTGHNFSEEWTVDKEPTCTEDGSRSHHCMNDGCEVIADSEVIPALGHSFGEWEVVKEATCTEEGEAKRTCSVCGETETQVIAKTAHTVSVEITKADLENDGSVVTRCEVCGEELSSEVIYRPAEFKLTAAYFIYSGAAKKPLVTVTDSNGEKIPSANYMVTYQAGRKNIGTYTVTVDMTGDYYSGQKILTFIIRGDLTKEETKVSIGSIGNKAFTGSAIKPLPVVKAIGEAGNVVTLKKDVDYTLSYSKNTSIGQARITIKGKGNYTGTKSINFKIVPPKVTGLKLSTPKSKQLKVTYKKASGGVSYQIWYRVKGTTTWTKKTATVTSKTFTSLKGGKTYQVKVRAYKKVDGTTYYGAWTAIKSLKVKK